MRVRAEDIDGAIAILKEEIKQWQVPAVGVVAEENDPFLVLVSCILSLRTRDSTTAQASERIFSLAKTPRSLSRLPVSAIRKAIYPVSFYRVKAKTLKYLAQDLLERFGGRVPDTMEELLSLKGVGRKTANLVLTLGHKKPGICVDIHVHRISNRWGYVKTKTPDDTEAALRRKLPRKHWNSYNDLLVTYGQNLCTPLSPWCSRCRLSSRCRKVGVGRRR